MYLTYGIPGAVTNPAYLRTVPYSIHKVSSRQQKRKYGVQEWCSTLHTSYLTSSSIPPSHLKLSHDCLLKSATSLSPSLILPLPFHETGRRIIAQKRRSKPDKVMYSKLRVLRKYNTKYKIRYSSRMEWLPWLKDMPPGRRVNARIR